MIGLPSFQLYQPGTVAEAVELLHRYKEDARVLAGGTDLLLSMRQRVATPGHVVHLGGIPLLRRIELVSSGLRVGALASVDALARHPLVRALFPVLSRAAQAVAGPTIRHMGTVGGNLCLDTRCHWYNQSEFWRSACGFCLKKDGDVCHVVRGSSICWAVYSGDLAPAFLTLDAEVVLESARGSRRVPLCHFYLEDGLRRMDLAPDEILTEVHVPEGRVGLHGVYSKLRARKSLDYPLAGVAVSARISDGRFHDASIALTAVGPRPFLVEGAREILEGVPFTDEDAIERAVQLARRVANPMRTGGSFSPSYRRHRVGLFVRDALYELGKAGYEGSPPGIPLQN